MQLKEANQLRKAWGNAPCDHPNLEKEYSLGADTGDWVCTQCGRSFPRNQSEQSRDKQPETPNDTGTRK